jgi:hypothetical protein
MSDLVRMPLDGGGSVLIRCGEDSSARMGGVGPVRAGRVGDRVGQAVAEATMTLQAAMEPVVAMSRAVLDQLAAVAPQSMEVEFGVELSAEAGAVIAQASGTGHLQVTLTWDGQAERSPASHS